jgi:hypothetical protein
MSHVRFAGRRILLPKHPVLRVLLGVSLIGCGIFGFLPVLGYWMAPLGLGVLATVFRPARRLYRKMTVGVGNYLHRRWPGMAGVAGYGKPRSHRARPEPPSPPDR